MSRALETLAAERGLVLLYHATFERVPESLSGDLHNVPPTALAAQLEYLGRFFRFVDVDTLAAAEDRRGLAAVTFDDGYRCVIDEALPVFERLGIPLTIYLNGAAFCGRIFWRDKVRLLGVRNWVAEFERSMRGIRPVPGRRFYRYSKMPLNNSARVDAELDRFLADRLAPGDLPAYWIDQLEDLPRHALVRYGNHGFHHYVMSSLDPGEQDREIGAGRRLLERLPAARRSGLFSLPFGDVGDFDAVTTRALRGHGYRRLLLSRGRLVGAPCAVHGIEVVERFMPRTAAADAGLADPGLHKS